MNKSNTSYRSLRSPSRIPVLTHPSSVRLQSGSTFDLNRSINPEKISTFKSSSNVQFNTNDSFNQELSSFQKSPKFDEGDVYFEIDQRHDFQTMQTLLMETPQPELIIDTDEVNFNMKQKSSNQNGAFKFYKTDLNDYSIENLEIKAKEEILKEDHKKKQQPNLLSNIDKIESNQKNIPKSRTSPFISIDEENNFKVNLGQPKLNKSSTQLNSNKPTRVPLNKFQSGSTNSLSINNRISSRNSIKFESTKDSAPRPATKNDINYSSADSDESSVVDNLINNPSELKRILKEGKMDKEKLGQLQDSYLNLLEQYAEKENFIDMFRLGINVNNLQTGNQNLQQVNIFIGNNFNIKKIKLHKF